jgi:hypothetical protein
MAALAVAMLVPLVTCGGDADAERTEDAAPAVSSDHATVALGDRTWAFSTFSCVIIQGGQYMTAVPQVSDDGSVRLSASYEPNVQSTVTVSAEDGSFQYSAGEAGPRPTVSIDGRVVKFEGTFVNDFDGSDRIEGSAEFRC